MLKTHRLRALVLCALLQFPSVAWAQGLSAYDSWVKALEALPAQTGDYANLVQALNVLNAINASINTSDDIRKVRSWGEDDALVDALIPFAAGAFAETRIPATLVLGNVVDNTNVCRVMTFIEADQGVTPDGRYNLLQVVRQVSYYAFDDTGAWITQLVDRWRTKFSGNPDLSKTQALLTQIQDVLALRTVGRGTTLRSFAGGKYTACQDLFARANVQLVVDLQGD